MAFVTKKISAVVGGLTATTAVAVVTSHSNVAGSFICNGVTYTVTFTICGNDRGSNDTAGVTHAFYFGTVSITGLTAFKKYSWTLTQGANSDSGTFYSSPSSKAAKFSIAPLTCFNPQGGQTTDADDPVTAFDFLDHYADVTEYPLIAILFSDDIYYADGVLNSTTVGCTNAQGKTFVTANNSAGTRPSYDFALNYGMWFGIMDSFRNTGDTVTPVISAARSEAWQRLKNKTAFMPQWGDHEFQNNLGWSGGSLLTAVPNGFHQAVAGDRLGKGLVVYEQLMTPLQGTRARSADLIANHWYADFGPLRYITPDPITNAVYASSILYGTDQINDCLTIAAAGSQWFTVIGNPAMAGRGTPNYDSALNTFNSSLAYAYKNENYFAAEYNRWWLNTGQTPKSLLDSSRTNGNLGVTVMTRGDNHYGAWFYWKAPAAAGVTAESIHEINLNTVNGSSGTTQWLTGGGGASFSSDNCELIGGISSHGNNVSTTNYCVTVIEIDGTLPTPQMVIKQWQYESNAAYGENYAAHFINNYETITDTKGSVWRVMAQRKFKLYGGNYATDVTEPGYEIPQASGTGTL